MQMPSGQTVVYQPTQHTGDAGTQQQQIQTIQLQASGTPHNSAITRDGQMGEWLLWAKTALTEIFMTNDHKIECDKVC